MKNVYLVQLSDNKVVNTILAVDDYTPPDGFSIIENDGLYQIGDTYGNPVSHEPTPEEIAAATKAALHSQIDALERAYMYPRGQRELDLQVMEKFAAEQGISAAELYTKNILYKKLKDLNNQIQALRDQL